MRTGNYIRRLSIAGKGWEMRVDLAAQDDDSLKVAQRELLTFANGLVPCAEKARFAFLETLRAKTGDDC